MSDAFAEDDSDRYYSHVVIDEGQDFSLQMLRTMVQAVEPDGSITLFGDAAQQIYGRGVSWKQAGLDVRKVWEFRRNYRNSPQIAALGQAIAAMPYFDDTEDMVMPDKFADAGPPPTLVRFARPADEWKWIVAQAKELGKIGTTGVLFQRNADARDFQHSTGCQLLDRDSSSWDAPTWDSQPGIWAATVNAAKGYEFQSVIIPQLNDSRWPEPAAVSNEGEAEALASSGRRLYVAVTRARQNLLLTCAGDPSGMLPVNDGLWAEQRA